MFCYFCFSFNSLAQTASPTNPVTTNPNSINLNDGTIGSPTNGCPSGTSSAYVYGSGSTIRFGECVNTFAVTYAINQALQGTGVSIDKVHYQWKYIHCFNAPNQFCSQNISDRVNTTTGAVTDDTYWDELVVVVELTDSSGNVVETKTWTMDRWYDWQNENAHSFNEVKEGSTYWQIHEDNIEIYNHIDKTGTIRTPNAVGDVRFRISGYDKGNWDGYYGPIIKDFKTWFTYRANPCNDTALYDPSCPGYSEAYAQYEYNQSCTANPLYDTGCPGYATAYFNQQCSADPLYDSGCPGYASAYYTQQCTADPLYDSGCDGYAAAYYTQQCTQNPLYDSGCDGYAAAYYTQQCTANPLYDSGCDGYAAAYYTQQCTANPLYDSGCDGYATAYFNQQCKASPLYDAACTGHFEAQCDASALYDIRCTGYDVAYLEQQCMYNPQYDETCTGYIEPIIETDPGTIVDDGTGTGDSIVDSVIALPVEIPDMIILPPAPAPAPAPVVVVVVPVEVEVTPVEITLEQELENEIANIEVAEAEISTSTTEENTTEVIVEPVEEITEETTEEVVVEEQTESESEGDPRGDQINESKEETTEEIVIDEDGSEEEVVEEKEEKKAPVIVKKTVKKPATKKVVKLSKTEKKKAKNKKMREIIKKKLALLAVTMGKAQSLENQQALQAQIAALINFVPGFNAYGKVAIPGVNFYQPEAIYLDEKVPENQRGLRNGLAQQILHEKMIDMQYERLTQ